MNTDQELQHVFAAHLLPRVDGLLVELLRSLDAGDREAQTVAPRWKVKDVAAPGGLAQFNVSGECGGSWYL